MIGHPTYHQLANMPLVFGLHARTARLFQRRASALGAQARREEHYLLLTWTFLEVYVRVKPIENVENFF